MRPKEFDFDPVDVDADGICESQTPAGAGNLDIDGALTSGGAATLDYARQLCIVSDGNDSGVTFTITGTDADGKAQTEDVTGPNATTVESTKYFKTVSQVAISGAGTGAITVGTVDELSSQTIPLDYRSDIAAMVNVDITGTVNFTVQETFDNLQQPVTVKPQQAAQWLDVTALASKTADTRSQVSIGATGIRLLFNSYSSGAEIQMNLIQPTSR
jgi:hypothetical protein